MSAYNYEQLKLKTIFLLARQKQNGLYMAKHATGVWSGVDTCGANERQKS